MSVCSSPLGFVVARSLVRDDLVPLLLLVLPPRTEAWGFCLLLLPLLLLLPPLLEAALGEVLDITMPILVSCLSTLSCFLWFRGAFLSVVLCVLC